MARATKSGSELGLQATLQDVPDSFLECRSLWHDWAVLTPMHVTEEVQGGDVIERKIVCERCTTTRTDHYFLSVDRYGVSRLTMQGYSYDYPDGYLMPEMAQVEHARELVRFEQFRRDTGGKIKQKKAS